MAHDRLRFEDGFLTRRELLCRSGMGMGALALGGVLSEAGLLGGPAVAADGSPATPALPSTGSMHADVPNHEPSLMLMNCGEARQARPCFGSWVLYGLGTENQNLPGFLVMCPGGFPIAESQNWQAAFLPGIYQGTYIDSRHSDIEKLIAHIQNRAVGPTAQRAQLDLLAELNRRHLDRRRGEAELEARIQSFELAYRMQSE